jgi:hypothetical protein
MKEFEQMKVVMGTCPVLSFPDFTLPFFLECDTSERGYQGNVDAGGHPIVFERRKLILSKEAISNL